MYKLLVADDEKGTRKGIITKLNEIGLNFGAVMEAEDGREAFAIIKAWKPDVVIADIEMPYMDGIGLLKRTRNDFPYIKFIMISKYAGFEHVQEAINSGAEGYILKPVTLADLKEILSRVIEELNGEKRVLQAESAALELKRVNENLRFERKVNEIFYNPVIMAAEMAGNSIGNINDGGDGYCVLAILNLNTKVNESTSFDNIKTKVKMFLKAKAGNYKARVIDNLIEPRQIFIIMFGQDKFILENDINEYTNTVFYEIVEKLHIPSTMSISRVSSGITSMIYEDAKYALSHRLFSGNNRIYRYLRDFMSSKNCLHNDYKLKMLQNLIDKGDLKNIKILLRSIFIKDNSNNLQYINIMYSKCIDILVIKCHKNNIELKRFIPYNMLNGDKICCYDDLNELVEDIYDKILKITDIIGRYVTCTGNIINKTEKYILGHIDKNITVNGLAKKFLISANYYSNLFRKEKGITLTKYITDVRLDRACNLLKETDIAISEISSGVGYQDPQYFSRIFKKEMGMTPSEYRKSYGRDSKFSNKLAGKSQGFRI